MKKIFTLVTTLFLSASLFAFAPQAKVTISNNSRMKVMITIDGNIYNTDRNANNNDDIMINDLRFGSHNIKIYQQSSRNRWDDLFGKKRQQLIFDGNINVRPQVRTGININRFGKVSVEEQQTGWQNDNHNGGYNNDHDYNSGTYNNHGGAYSQVMNGRAFDQLKYSINSASYDNSKLDVAKQAIAANYFTAAQVKELMQLFAYESSKMDIAKFAYTYTVDKENYFIVNDAFGYNTSRDELTRYLQQRR